MHCEAICVFLLYFTALAACSPEMRALHHRLFSNYSAHVRPVLREENKVQVNVSMSISTIQELDLLRQTLNTAGYMDIVWQDEYLVWNPEENANITAIVLPQSHVWLPDITIENEVNGAYYFGNDKVQVQVKHDGTVTWQPSYQTTTECKVDIFKYPLDRQTCGLIVIPWMTTREHATVNFLVIDIDPDLKNGEFWLVEAGIERGAYEVTFSSEPIDYGMFKLVLKRRYVFYLLSSIIPLAAFSLLSPMALLVPAGSGEKITLSVTVLLANLVFLGSLSDSMPRVSDSISVFVMYASLQILVSFTAVIINVALLCMSHMSNTSSSSCSSDGNNDNANTLDANNSKNMEAASLTNCKLIRKLKMLGKKQTNSPSIVQDSSAVRSSPLQTGRVYCVPSVFHDAETRKTFQNVFDSYTQNATAAATCHLSEDGTTCYYNSYQAHGSEDQENGSNSFPAPIGRRDRLCFLGFFLAVICINVVCFTILIL